MPDERDAANMTSEAETKKHNTNLELGLDQLCTVLLQKLKQLCILDASHLQDLCRAIGEVPVSNGLQERLVNEDGKGSAVRAHLVLPAMEVDSCLDTNGSINSCHDCGWNLDQGSVASVQVGSKACHIQAYSSTDSNNGLLASA